MPHKDGLDSSDYREMGRNRGVRFAIMYKEEGIIEQEDVVKVEKLSRKNLKFVNQEIGKMETLAERKHAQSEFAKGIQDGMDSVK